MSTVVDSATQSTDTNIGPVLKPIQAGPISRDCAECETPIHPLRLVRHPDTDLCARCQEKVADVQPYRRYDETTRDGDLVETLFKANPYIERQLYRLNSTDRATSAIPSAEEPRDIEAVISGRGLTAVMESPEDEIIARVDEERAARAA